MNNKIKVHCLGPCGTHGHEVSKKVFGNSIGEIIFHQTNPDVLFGLQEDGSEDSFAIVPIENSKGGLVTEVVTNFWMSEMGSLINHEMMRKSIEVIGEYRHFVNQSLVANLGRKNKAKIRRIFSHPQALRQCEENIRGIEQENQKEIELVPVSSTSGSISEIKKPGDAAICSPFAAENFLGKGLVVVRTSFNDNDDNQTLFHVLTIKPEESVRSTHCAVLLALMDKPGALVDALNCVSSFGSNMHIMDSIPTGIPGKCAFYVEYNEPAETEKGQRILDALEGVAEKMVVLGSFRQFEKGDMF